jgi:hypothetical protein
VGFERGETRGKILSFTELKSQRASEAPQVVLARDVRNEVTASSIGDWDERMRKICMRIHRDQDLDVFLKYVLFRYTLELVPAGNSMFAAALESTLEKLRNSEMDPATKRMDPEDSQARELKEKAKRLLEDVAGFEAAWEAAAVSTRRLSDDLNRDFVFVGALSRDAGGGWRCDSPWKSPEPHDLFVLSRGSEAGSPVSMQQIGEARDGQISLRTLTSMSGVVQGTMLIGSRKPSAQPTAARDQAAAKPELAGQEGSK